MPAAAWCSSWQCGVQVAIVVRHEGDAIFLARTHVQRVLQQGRRKRHAIFREHLEKYRAVRRVIDIAVVEPR